MAVAVATGYFGLFRYQPIPIANVAPPFTKQSVAVVKTYFERA